MDRAGKTGLTDVCDILAAMFLDFPLCLPQLDAKKYSCTYHFKNSLLYLANMLSFTELLKPQLDHA